MIGQALNEDRGFDKEPERVKQEEAQREHETEKRLRTQRAAVYESLSAEEQAALGQLARKNLLQQGIKPEFLLEPIVRTEVLRLVGEKQDALDEAENKE